MRIDIYSDTICPWCFIGKRRFEKALAQRPDLDIEIHWCAFQLNPDMPEAGMERQDYLETKFGGPANAREVYARVEAAGAMEDIPFAFDAIKRTPNTVASHRLIRYAATQPIGQDPLVEVLFHDYFLDGKDIGDIEVLVAAAGRAGLDAGACRQFLQGDDETQAVLSEDARARQIGVQGVPFFVLDGKYAVSGAQTPGHFLAAFDQVLESADAVK